MTSSHAAQRVLVAGIGNIFRTDDGFGSADPATVLATLGSLGGRLPQRAVVVGCQVADVGDGMGMTPLVAAAVEPAVRVVQDVVSLLTGVDAEVV